VIDFSLVEVFCAEVTGGLKVTLIFWV